MIPRADETALGKLDIDGPMMGSKIRDKHCVPISQDINAALPATIAQQKVGGIARSKATLPRWICRGSGPD